MLPQAPATFQVQLGGTAGFNSTSTNRSGTNTNSPTVGDAYFSTSVRLAGGVSLYQENLIALRRGRNSFNGVGLAFQFGTEAGYLGAGLGGYGGRGTGVRWFVGWPTGKHQTFELSYTRLSGGFRTDPVFTYGVRF
jgi:hypothetical protein